MKIVIHYNLSFSKYIENASELPYFATGQKLADEIHRHDPAIGLVVARDDKDLRSALADADGLVCYGTTREELDAGGKLRWIQAGSAGIDHFFKSSNVDLAELARRQIRLTKAAGVTGNVIGEHVFAMILALSRNVPQAVRQQMRREWSIFMGTELAGTTLGVIGLGGIGERVAQLGKAFGMQVIGTKRDCQGYQGAADAVLPADQAVRVAAAADYLVLACPLTPLTRGIVTAAFLAQMRPSAVLVNVARGELINEDDLVHALRTGVIAAAALDTFGTPGRNKLSDLESLDASSELWALPNVLIMPNNASATPRIYEHLAAIVVDNATRLQRGEPLHAEVRHEDIV